MSTIKISFRNLWKNRNSSTINLIGLTVALTSVVFIFMWVHHELTFDNHNTNYKNIYMVASEWMYSDGKSDFIMETPTPLSPYLKENFPEVIQSTRFAKQFGGRFLEVDNKRFLEDGFVIEPSFFDIFTVDFVLGNPNSISGNPNSICISQRLASKFFGEANPINKSITFFENSENTKQYQVCGIYKDIPDNSSLQFDFLIPTSFNEADNWFSFGFSTFVLLQNEIDKTELNKETAKFYNSSKLGFDINFYLHPLKDMHFHSDYQLFVYHPGDIQYVYIFTIAGIFILLIAALNFMGLVTTLITNRLKESGLRKISGASKIKIISSFISEPFILVALSLLLTFIAVELIQPTFNSFSDNTIPSIHQNAFILLALICLGFLIGLISGIFPGLYIARINPFNAIKQHRNSGNGTFRKNLVVLQFTLAIIILSSTILIHRQMNYIFHKDLGFNKENILHIPLKGKIRDNFSLIKHELLNNPMIEGVTNSNPLLSSGIEMPGWTWTGISGEDKHSIAHIQADGDFINTFEFSMVQGNNFSDENLNTNKVIINEEAAKVMNMANPTHKFMQLKGKSYEIIGIVKNFHSRHFSNQIRPLMISYSEGGSNLYIRYKKGVDNADIINFTNNVYQNYNPEFPFEYRTFKDEFNATYRDENKMLKLLMYFVFVVFLILIIGLYGLSKQVAIRKVKEIGIRKVNGATISEVLFLLNKDFVKWITFAIIIATPIAFFSMKKWLEGFAYRTTLSWWIFVLADVLSLVVALLTAGWQSWRAATRNPVEALRYE